MKTYPRHIKRQLWDLRAQAHESELGHALAELNDCFAAWKRDALTTVELCDEIHRFHDGPSRDLYNYYNRAPLEIVVARAVARGILDEHDIPDDVLAEIHSALDLCRSQLV